MNTNSHKYYLVFRLVVSDWCRCVFWGRGGVKEISDIVWHFIFCEYHGEFNDNPLDSDGWVFDIHEITRRMLLENLNILKNKDIKISFN